MHEDINQNKRKPVRVLQVLDKLSLNSGASAVVMNYYRWLNKEKIIFDFLLHEKPPGEFRDLLIKNKSKYYVMPELKSKNLKTYRRALRQFFNEHKEYKIVHGHIPNAAGFYLGEAKKAGVPVRILHSHNTSGADQILKKLRNNFLNKWAVRQASVYFACSKKAALYLFGKKKASLNKVFLLKNAVDLKRFSYNSIVRDKMRKELKIENAFVIGHIGRFCNQKNHHFLLQIFMEIIKINENSRLLLLGDGDLKQQIENEIKDLNLEKYVLLEGVRENVSDYMQAMDILVLPSLFEGLPVVGIEAQAAGLPCVFSDRITKEASVTGGVQFLPLEMEAKEWAKRVIDLGSCERNMTQSMIRQAGYDIQTEANHLEELYLNSISKNI